MSLKDISEQTQEKPAPEEELDKVKASMMMDSMIEGSMYYLFGCLFTYYKLNEWEPIDPEQAVTELRALKEIDGIDTDDDVKEFLENSDEKLHQFLRWYMYDSR